MASLGKLGRIPEIVTDGRAALVCGIKRAEIVFRGIVCGGRLSGFRPGDGGTARVAAGRKPRTLGAHSHAQRGVALAESFKLRGDCAVRGVATAGFWRKT